MSNWVMVTKEEGEFLAHSSGPWKKHKYVSKDGKRYIYSNMGNGGRNKTGRDLSDATKEKLTGIKPRLNKNRIAKAASGELHKEQERKEVKNKMTVLRYGKLNKDHIRKAASGELHGRESNVKAPEELRAEKRNRERVKAKKGAAKSNAVHRTNRTKSHVTPKPRG